MYSIPWESLFGGMLLGFSAVFLMIATGKIAGISGIVSVLVSLKDKNSKPNDLGWRLAFVFGMVTSALIVAPFGFDLPDVSNMSLGLVAIAGLLVGFGTRLANGCTSGHGIIGLGRLSKRSIVATATFMTTAVLVVLVKRLMGWM